MMNDEWYEVAAASAQLTQGDLIFECPIITWNVAAISDAAETNHVERLRQAVTALSVDVVVMTQACDLEHDKVQNVVLCPHAALSDFRKAWEEDVRGRNQNPTPKAWRRLCEDVADGYVWNQTFLNRPAQAAFRTELRVVDFHQVFTAPRVFLETLLLQRNQPRLRLRPPYREHLSQAFARFFMRVGLPLPVSKDWESSASP